MYWYQIDFGTMVKCNLNPQKFLFLADVVRDTKYLMIQHKLGHS